MVSDCSHGSEPVLLHSWFVCNHVDFKRWGLSIGPCFGMMREMRNQVQAEIETLAGVRLSC